MRLTILYAEDFDPVADAVKETLEEEGWTVVLCNDGAKAFQIISGTESYDLFLFDNGLPNVDGLELTRHARQLPHRKNTPIVMLSAMEIGKEALKAGVNIFLKKPEGMRELVDSIKRLV
jgi:CheY-like chemotaxis protein